MNRHRLDARTLLDWTAAIVAEHTVIIHTADPTGPLLTQHRQETP